MAIIKLGGEIIKVSYLSNLTNETNKIIRRNVKSSIIMHLSNIMIVDNYYNLKGILESNKCRIYHEQLGWMILNEPFEEIQNIKMDGTIQIKGFQQKKKRILKPIKLIKPNARKTKVTKRRK